MKILGISGSPRKENTSNMLKTVCEAMGKEHEIVFLKDKNIAPCNDCRSCHKTYQCIIKDDMQEIRQKLEKADFIVLGSPTYFHNVSGLMKNFMDRCLPFYFSRKLEGKKAVLLTAGGFKNYLEFDKNGKCLWHKEEKICVKRCLKSLEYFCDCLGIKVIGSEYALHDEWIIKEKKLVGLVEKIYRNNKRI